MIEEGFRPRYKFHYDADADEIKQRIVSKSKENNPDGLIVRNVHGHLVLDIPNESRHFWSPHMDVNLEVEGDSSKTLVRCLIGPSPTVWTLFMFFYGFFGFAAFIGLTLGLSQWTMNKPMWGFWLLPIALIGMGLMYFISYEGKKLSKAEMWQLKNFIDESLGCDCLSLSDQQLKDQNNFVA
ncbi:MAG: hypothetical protein WEC59_10480 [Salibacteraceae bacterium]